MLKQRNGPYHAYLLRCWQEGDVGTGQGLLWRFSVEGVFGERHRQGFGGLEALVAFLKAELVAFDRR